MRHKDWSDYKNEKNEGEGEIRDKYIHRNHAFSPYLFHLNNYDPNADRFYEETIQILNHPNPCDVIISENRFMMLG